MSFYNRLGPPNGMGPMTGRRRGFCRRAFGDEEPDTSQIIDVERSPTASEQQLWASAEQSKERVVLSGYRARLLMKQILVAAKIAEKHNFDLGESELPDLEQRMITALNTIEQLRRYHCDVNGMQAGVSPHQNGKDLDIVLPNTSIGAIWVPIAIGAVLVAGIIARWAYLEREVSEITNKFNGIVSRADISLCSDPNSEMCADWKKTKATGDYYKRQTVIDKIGDTLKSVGRTAQTGFGWGIALAIPILIFMYMPRRKE